MSAGFALLCPGQGAQFVGMGRDLAERFPAARAVFEEADEALGFSLSRLCFEGPAEELTLTKNAQPAILVHTLAVWRALEPRGLRPTVAAGHSLGEFSAYVAAGSLAFADAVRTVRRRGELMFAAGDARPGTMAALLGLEDEEVERVCREASSGDEVVVAANFNAPGQVVISGDLAAVERAGALAKDAGARRVLPLSVSGAFHSPLMQVAEEGLRQQLADTELRSPSFPVVSNVTARPVSEPGEARTLLVRQLTSPVRWVASCRTMLEDGAERFLEIGPGNVLSGLLRRVHQEASARAVGTADEVATLLNEEETWS